MWSKILFAAVACAFSCGAREIPAAYAETPSAAVVSTDVDTEEPRTASITIVAGGKKFTYTDEKITPSDFTVSEYIETHNINAPLADKLDTVDTLLKKGASYKTALGVCFPLLTATVDKVAADLYVPAVNAEVVYKNGVFSVTSERAGAELDENRLYAGIYYCFKFGGESINATTVRIDPDVKSAELKSNLVLRGAYTTDYHTSTADRAHNVTLALKKYDGLRIRAGETVSFNQTVGARTVENGFKTAKIIVDGKYTDGVGGGVCQASTAVYNAALLAGLKCNANAHSICPSYCPAGLDAMISSVSDLTVTNVTAHDVFISVKYAGGRATVKFFGERNEYEIVPESVIVDKRPFADMEIVDKDRKFFGADAVSGDRLLVSQGKDGIISETYLKYYKNGKFVKRVKLRVNEYKSLPQIFAIAP